MTNNGGKYELEFMSAYYVMSILRVYSFNLLNSTLQHVLLLL